jgi:hypothetical protein
MEEHRLRVLDNRMLIRIPGPKRGKLAVGWRRLTKEELCNL